MTKLYNILTNKWILWNVFIRLLKIPLRPYNEKKFEVYYFRGAKRTSSKCLIYFHCPTVTKKIPANLWDEKTITFIILSLDEARHIFVTKIAGSICPQRLACVKKSIWVANSTRYSVSFSQVFGTHRGGGYTPIYMTTNFWINTIKDK